MITARQGMNDVWNSTGTIVRRAQTSIRRDVIWPKRAEKWCGPVASRTVTRRGNAVEGSQGGQCLLSFVQTTMTPQRPCPMLAVNAMELNNVLGISIART
jgi:hypothetical protein